MVNTSAKNLFRVISMIFLIFYHKSVHCANILGVFPLPFASHQTVFQAIWRELSLRGHNVTVVTTLPLNDTSLINLTEIGLNHTQLQTLWRHGKKDNKSMDMNVFQDFDFTYRLVDRVAEVMFNNEEFQELIQDKNKKFDLILIECFFPVLYFLMERFKAPLIGVSSLGMLGTQHNLVGSPNNQLLYPDMLLGSSAKATSVWEKMRNVLYGVWSVYYHYYCLLPRENEMGKKYFGNNVPYLEDVERNLSMFYINTNRVLHPPRPQVPVMLETSPLHIKPVKPLPKDLQKILDESHEGVVYFSLGSNIKSTSIDDKLRVVITQALSELPYKVIWKWESDYLPDKPANVIIRKWLPQQDLLAHPNIRVFVTQGGQQSMEEAISRAVPIVGLPLLIDQHMNTEKLAALGLGLCLDFKTITKEKLKKGIIEVFESTDYKKRMRKFRDILLDKQNRNTEMVVWWSEYVIRRNGARHMRSPSADISWFHYFMVDVCFAFVTTIVLVTYGGYKLCKVVFAKKYS